jgi:hypothetical protein
MSGRDATKDRSPTARALKELTKQGGVVRVGADELGPPLGMRKFADQFVAPQCPAGAGVARPA